MKYVYLIMPAMSLALFILMGIDKQKAKKEKWRIPEKRLFIFAFLGGAVGGTLGMYVFHHKTKHWYFKLGFPAIAIIQIAVCVYLQFFGNLS